jgi:hypothetical protein
LESNILEQGASPHSSVKQCYFVVKFKNVYGKKCFIEPALEIEKEVRGKTLFEDSTGNSS